MPCCPNCKTNRSVVVHGFRVNHVGHLMIGLYRNEFIISRRYKCKCCEKKRQELQQQVQNFADNSRVEVTVGTVQLKYTFMSFHPECLLLHPYGRGDQFPPRQKGRNLREMKEYVKRCKTLSQGMIDSPNSMQHLQRLLILLKVQRPGPMPLSELQAMCEEPYTTVGRMSIGKTQLCVPDGIGSRKGKPDQKCKCCEKNQCSFKQICKDRASKGTCQFFDCISINTFVDVPLPCKLCSKFNRNQPSCQGYNEQKKQRICIKFNNDRTRK